jgi:hypothetical protein
MVMAAILFSPFKNCTGFLPAPEFLPVSDFFLLGWSVLYKRKMFL